MILFYACCILWVGNDVIFNYISVGEKWLRLLQIYINNLWTSDKDVLVT